jgi:hypothetical protein
LLHEVLLFAAGILKAEPFSRYFHEDLVIPNFDRIAIHPPAAIGLFSVLKAELPSMGRANNTAVFDEAFMQYRPVLMGTNIMEREHLTVDQIEGNFGFVDDEFPAAPFSKFITFTDKDELGFGFMQEVQHTAPRW